MKVKKKRGGGGGGRFGNCQNPLNVINFQQESGIFQIKLDYSNKKKRFDSSRKKPLVRNN